MGLKTIVKPKKNKKERYDITNVSMKGPSKIIKKFKILPYKGYVWKRPKHEPTGSYFYPTIQLAKCMMRYDAFNFHVDPVRTKMTGMQHIPISHVCGSDEIRPKGIIADEKLS